jgi:hypothetical protein
MNQQWFTQAAVCALNKPTADHEPHPALTD